MSKLCFQDEVALSLLDRIVVIPKGIHSKNALLERLCSELQFPAYFGWSWDALFDCLCDLAWIAERRVVLLHRDIPLSDTKEQEMYLDVLSDAVESWLPHEDHELVVFFPADYKRISK